MHDVGTGNQATINMCSFKCVIRHNYSVGKLESTVEEEEEMKKIKNVTEIQYISMRLHLR